MTRSLTSAIIAVMLAMGALAQSVAAQTTEFTYQGSLKNASAAANGNFDFEFLLFDAVSGGTQVGSTITTNTVAVANGTFSVKLDFGPNYPGANRFLEIHVRQTGGGAFTPLAPRQSVSTTPYAVKSLNADSAANATNATNAINASTATNAAQLGGLAANQYVVTTDPRMTDTRAPAAGSGNYIQNTISTQSSSNFNISGNGIFGGNVGIGTTAPQYRLDVQTGTGAAISGTSSSSSPIGVIGTATSPSVTFGMAHAAPAGVWGTSTTGTGVEGSSDSNIGVVGESSSNPGVLGTSTTNIGVYGYTQGISGVYGRVDNSSTSFGSAYIGKAGVWGTSSSSVGVVGTSDSNVGVAGVSQSNIGVLGTSLTGDAGFFSGTVQIRKDSSIATDWQTGQLRISGGSDPNKQLSLGYDDLSNTGVIQAGQANTAYTNLLLNPFGGNVAIGISPGTNNAKLDSLASDGQYGVRARSTNFSAVLAIATTGAGVLAQSTSGEGVFGSSSTNAGVYGLSSGTFGVNGVVNGPSTNFGSAFVGKAGVWGTSTSSVGVYGTSDTNVGVVGVSQSLYGVYGRSTGNYAGFFQGNVYVTGTLTQNSDARLKRDVSKLGYGLREVLMLQPVSWTWKEESNGPVNLGLIAQEVELIIPELVSTSKDAEQTKGLNYIGLVPVLVNAVKEQQAQIDQQHRDIQQLIAANGALSRRLKVVERRLKPKHVNGSKR